MLAQKHQIPFHTHAAETQDEVNRVIALHNERCLTFFNRIGATNTNLCLAHCVWLNDREKELLAEKNVNVLHCPGSNLKLGSGIAPIPEYLDKGITVSLGTDGAACNNNLDLFFEMRLAALIQKPRFGPEAMNAETVFNMATRAGAATLNLENEIGSIEVGKCADIVLIRRAEVNTIPFDNIYSKLVYSTKANAVEHVMVDGFWVVVDGKPTYFNLADIIHDVNLHSKRFN
jgi:cytosine/adenosine deaminase-related metal-dependent hydrolase